MLRPWTSMPPTQCEANCTAAAVWRRSRRDPVHIRALRGPRWDAGIARDGCVGVLLSAVSRPCGQGITWPRTSTTHKTSTILNAMPLPIQRDQRARRIHVIDSTGANARPARREAWVPQQRGPWALLRISPGPATVSFRPPVRNCPVHCSRSQPQSAFGRCHAIFTKYIRARRAFKSNVRKARGVRCAPPALLPHAQHATHHARDRFHSTPGHHTPASARLPVHALKPTCCLTLHAVQTHIHPALYHMHIASPSALFRRTLRTYYVSHPPPHAHTSPQHSRRCPALIVCCCVSQDKKTILLTARL